MGIGADDILSAIAVGIGATLVMDLWNLFLKRAFGLQSLNYCFLGRWLRHMPDGTFRHASIAAAPQRSFECAVGWLAHYSIGAAFALVFVVLASGEWLARPTVVGPLLYGIGTVVFPFFIMQPALGLGVAASKAPLSSAGQAEEPPDTCRFRSRALRLCTRGELLAAQSGLATVVYAAAAAARG